MHRRRFLVRAVGLAGASGLAGCLGGPAGSVATPTDTPTPGPPPSGEHPVTPTETSFDVIGRACGSGDDAATVRFEDDAVNVEGTIGGRDTCDTARLA